MEQATASSSMHISRLPCYIIKLRDFRPRFPLLCKFGSKILADHQYEARLGKAPVKSTVVSAHVHSLSVVALSKAPCGPWDRTDVDGMVYHGVWQRQRCACPCLLLLWQGDGDAAWAVDPRTEHIDSAG